MLHWKTNLLTDVTNSQNHRINIKLFHNKTRIVKKKTVNTDRKAAGGGKLSLPLLELSC